MRRLIFISLVLGMAGCARDDPHAPSLAGMARQQIIAGHFANTPDMLTQWIESPQEMLPGNAMPDMRLTHAQAREIASYLYTLEQR